MNKQLPIKKPFSVSSKLCLVKTISNSALIVIGCLALGSPLHAAITCDASNQSLFTWDNRDWPAPTGSGATFNPTLAHTETVDGIDFNFAFSSDQSNADFINSLSLSSVPSPNDTTAGVGADLDGDNNLDEGLAVIVDPVSATTGQRLDMDVFLDVNLSSPISELEFFVTDVDEGFPSRRDQVTVIGFLNGVQVLPVASHFPGAVNVTTTLVGNVATTNPGAGQRFPNTNPQEAVVAFTFDSPIDSFRVIYADDEESAGNVGVIRGISMMSDFSFCPAPDLSVTKTDGQANYTPGGSFSYDIVVANNGPGSANGSTFTDTLPAWAEGVTWTCVAAGSAVCPNANGTGNAISEVIAAFPNGGSLTYTVNGTYSTDMANYP